MADSTPLVSVVTPSYNRPSYVIDSMLSVNEQTYPNIEHIVVDDYSETPVTSVLSRSSQITADIRSHVEIIRHSENKGANAARNTGINAANGEFIAFLDDDDEWYPDKLKKQVECAKKSNAGVVYTGIEQVSNGTVTSRQIPTIRGVITRELLSGTPIKSTSTVLVRSDVFNKAGKFDTELKNHQDWEFYIRASNVTEFDGVREVLVVRKHHDAQISRDYETKRNSTVPHMKRKHSSLAESLGLKNQYYATLEETLGATAIEAGDYQSARKHYIKALYLSPCKNSVVRVVALLAGRKTYKLAQLLNRAIF